MEAFMVNTANLVSDVIGCVAELKNTFHTEGQPINDDNVTLQKFCVKLETILRHEQKEKYTLLGIRKDYWNFINDVISKDDGIKYVNMVPQVKTSQGKGRSFIRYALVKQTLADTIQRLLVSGSTLSSWYRGDAILRNPSLSTALINKLYDLNDVEFDLPCSCYDLDISWPAFSRRTVKDGVSTGRRSSVSSMSSVDFRNERRDPLLDLVAEITSLTEFFESEVSSLPRESHSNYYNVSLTSASEPPSIHELALQVSSIHKRALAWKSDFINERATAANCLRKAQDDRQFAIQESELKTKQLMEKFSNLTKTSSEENEKKMKVLNDKLTSAEESLLARDIELKALREEVNKSVFSSSTAHKSAIELEKQLMVSERTRTKLQSEVDSLKSKVQTMEQSEGELSDKESKLKERIAISEEKELEYKEIISELRGNIKAKDVALENIQSSFESLTGMVFGSFEELEANMKDKLDDKEKGLQHQTVENRKLEIQITDLQHQLDEATTALSEHQVKLKNMEALSNEDAENFTLLRKSFNERDGEIILYKTVLTDLLKEFEEEVGDDTKFASLKNQEIQEYSQVLLSNVKRYKSKLSLEQDKHTLKNKELDKHQETNAKLNELLEVNEQLLQTLQTEAQEKQNVIETLTTNLNGVKSENARLSSEKDEIMTSINVLNEEIKFLTEEKTTMEAQAKIDRQQLEMANEGRIRAEHAQVKAEEEVKNVNCVMEQEIAALKFQLSSETMRFEEEIKVFSEQTRENEAFKERSLTLEDKIAGLEISLKDRTDEWEAEKRKYVSDIKRLKSQVQLLNNAFEGNKQKMTTLENNLILSSKQLDEERNRQKQQILELETRNNDNEKQLQTKISEMTHDMKDLKYKIIALTREKADLWEKAASFEHELKLKATDRWVEDNEVNKCSSCKTEFSFLLRKHHCRLCGRIFCHSCSNNWVRTAHSSKLKRVCNSCLSKDQRLKPQQRNPDSEVDYDETMSDISFGASPRKDTSTSSIDLSEDEQQPDPQSTIVGLPVPTKGEVAKETTSTGKLKKTRSAIILGQDESLKSTSDEQLSSKGMDPEKCSSPEGGQVNTTIPADDPARATSPEGDGYEFIDQNEEIGELTESRVVVSGVDVKDELVIPAVNDEEGVSRDFTVYPGTRHIIPVMVATQGAVLCWSFKTLYKSIIFGLAYKQLESVSDDDIETLYPLARFSSNETAVEGEWKTTGHGVFVLVFDNSFSRFLSKYVSCVIRVTRRPSLLNPT